MDVTIFPAARDTFSALDINGSLYKTSGVLLGHQRGRRFFIENAAAMGKSLSSPVRRFYELDRLYNGSILGFFTSGADQTSFRKVLAPFACGLVFLNIVSGEKGPVFETYMIDYEGDFALVPIPLK